MTTPEHREGLRHECLSLCRAIAGADLGGLPLYIVFGSELPMTLQGRGCGGLCGGDAILRPYIGRRWRGRGTALTLCDHLPEVRAMNRERARQWAFEIVLHELAHALDPVELRIATLQAKLEPIPSLTQLAADGAKVVEGMHGLPPGYLAGDPRLSLPLWAHGWLFVRTCAHLLWRAERLGLKLDPTAMFPHWNYHAAPLVAFAEALEGEPAKHAGAGLAAIQTLPLPDAFRRLWRQGVGQWLLAETARLYGRPEGEREAFAVALAAARADLFTNDDAAMLAA